MQKLLLYRTALPCHLPGRTNPGYTQNCTQASDLQTWDANPEKVVSTFNRIFGPNNRHCFLGPPTTRQLSCTAYNTVEKVEKIDPVFFLFVQNSVAPVEKGHSWHIRQKVRGLVFILPSSCYLINENLWRNWKRNLSDCWISGYCSRIRRLSWLVKVETDWKGSEGFKSDGVKQEF